MKMKKKILLIDDNTSFIEYFKNTINKIAYLNIKLDISSIIKDIENKIKSKCKYDVIFYSPTIDFSYSLERLIDLLSKHSDDTVLISLGNESNLSINYEIEEKYKHNYIIKEKLDKDYLNLAIKTAFDKKELQSKISEYRQVINTFVDNSFKGIFTTDMNGKIEGMNDNAEEIFKLSKDNNLESEVSDYVKNINKENSNYNSESNILDSEFHSKYKLTMNKIKLNGRNKYLGIIHDSDKSKEEKMLKRAEELERSNSDLEKFAYIVSHDLKSPLNAITGYIQLINMKLKSFTSDLLIDDIENKVNNRITYMRKMIDDLLEYSKVGQGEKNFTDESINKIIIEAIHNLKPNICEDNIKIKRLNIPSLQVDRYQIVRLFQNLIGNAIKFKSIKEQKY